MKENGQIVVKKFGGTSVGSIERIEKVADRLVSAQASGESPIVVCSAMSGETNRLVKLAHGIDPHLKGPAFDMLLASGEQVSISLLSMALEKRGLKAKPLLAYQLGIQTDALFSKARIKSVDTEKLRSLLKEGVIPVVAGFQGVNNLEITTLGRGGSDTTAVALAAALGESVCEIYTDVAAVCSADPRLIPKASEISALSFSEMMEMSSLGSKVLHSRSVELAAKYDVKIHLRSSFETREGTWVMNKEASLESPVVTAVTHEMSTAIVKIFPVPAGTKALADLFDRLSAKSILVDIITQSYNEEGQRLAFSINEEDIAGATRVIKDCFGEKTEITVLQDVAKLSVVGMGMRTHSGVASRFFNCLGKSDIGVHLVTTSDIKISVVVDSKHLESAAVAIHTEFGLDKN